MSYNTKNIIFDASNKPVPQYYSTSNDQYEVAQGINGALNMNIVNPIPAGTNNIGDIDVLTLPPLPAGTNNIGDVDVLTLPALPAGTNLLGKIGIDQTTPGTTNLVAISNVDIAISALRDAICKTGATSKTLADIVTALTAALPAGTNNIGDVDVLTLPAGVIAGMSSLPSGTNNIGDVDILTIPNSIIAGMASLPTGTNNIGDVDVLTLPVLPTGSNVIGKVSIDQTTPGTTNGVQITTAIPAGTNVIGSTTGSCVATTTNATPFRLIATASTNLTCIKASAGRLYMLKVTNTSASMKYFKLYNKASAPVLASDTPIHTYGIPATSSFTIIELSLVGEYFSTGIAFATTGAIGDTDTTNLVANDLIINAIYI